MQLQNSKAKLQDIDELKRKVNKKKQKAVAKI